MRWLLPVFVLNMAACNALFSFPDKHPADAADDHDVEDTSTEADAAAEPVDDVLELDADEDAEEDVPVDPLIDDLPDGPVDDCTGMPNFFPCLRTTTSPDYAYDICSDGTCITPGRCSVTACNPPGPHYPLPAVDRAPGEFTSSAPAGGGEFVVVDGITGLMWQDAMPGSYPGCTWSGGEYCTQVQALAYCDGLSWAGFDDWHLPDEYELMSIVDYGTARPAINAPPFVLDDSLNGAWWSLAIRSGTDGHIVSHESGVVVTLFVDYGAKVRCVRPHLSGFAIRDRFTRTVPVADQPMVEDAVTGIEWQGCAKGFTIGGTDYCRSGSADSEWWGNADRYCEDLDWGGHDDWSLPDVRQLRSILDSRIADAPKIDTIAFPDFTAGMYWTSTTSQFTSGHTWQVDFGDGRARGICNGETSLCYGLVLCSREP